MNAEHFTFFARAVKQMTIIRKQNPDKVVSWLGGNRVVGGNGNGSEFKNNVFDRGLAETLSNSRIFEISDDIKKLLMMTDTPKRNEQVRLPFNEIFLDVAFSREEFEAQGISPKYADYVRGIAITTGNFVFGKNEIISMEEYEAKKKVGLGIRISICSVINSNVINADEGISECIFDVFNKNINIDEEAIREIGQNPRNITIEVTETTDEHIRDFIHKFVLNFLNFLDNPSVQYVEHIRSEKNVERRMKLGKPIIPSTFTIKITGKLKEYIDDIESKGLWTYSYKFWVRGYFRTLKDARYKENIGKRLWIPPFIKGHSGILIEKDYVLSSE